MYSEMPVSTRQIWLARNGSQSQFARNELRSLRKSYAARRAVAYPSQANLRALSVLLSRKRGWRGEIAVWGLRYNVQKKRAKRVLLERILSD